MVPDSPGKFRFHSDSVKLLSLGVALLVLGQHLAAAPLTPDQAVRQAVATHPDLAAGRLLITEAAARVDQSGRPDNPELKTEVKPNLNGQEGALAVGFSQRLPLTGRLRRHREVARADLAAAEAELRETERQVATRVALGVAELMVTAAVRDVREKQLASRQNLANQLADSAARGEGSEVDVRRIRLEVAQLATGIRQLGLDLRTRLGQLRSLMNLPPDAPLEIEADFPAVIASVPDHQPEAEGIPATPRTDLLVAGARVESARRATRLAESERWQDLGVSLVAESQRTEDIPAGRLNDHFVGLQLSLPLPWWNRNRGRIRETRLAAERLEVERGALARRIENERTNWTLRLAAATAFEHELAETQLPQAIGIEDELARQRAAGEATFADCARAREQRIAIEADLVGARADRLRSWLQLQSALGRIPTFSANP